MRPGLLLATFFALLVVTSAGLLSASWAEREFSDLGGAVAPTTIVCFRLDARDSADPELPVPRVIRLDTTPVAGHRGWYEAQPLGRVNAAADSLTTLTLPRWRPAGRDSIDIVTPGWPVAAKLRIAVSGDTLRGRLVLFGDASFVVPFNGSLHQVTWPPVQPVRAPSWPVRAKPPDNERCT